MLVELMEFMTQEKKGLVVSTGLVLTVLVFKGVGRRGSGTYSPRKGIHVLMD